MPITNYLMRCHTHALPQTLRDMSGPMSAEDMERQMKPAPFGGWGGRAGGGSGRSLHWMVECSQGAEAPSALRPGAAGLGQQCSFALHAHTQKLIY